MFYELSDELGELRIWLQVKIHIAECKLANVICRVSGKRIRIASAVKWPWVHLWCSKKPFGAWKTQFYLFEPIRNVSKVNTANASNCLADPMHTILRGSARSPRLKFIFFLVHFCAFELANIGGRSLTACKYFSAIRWAHAEEAVRFRRCGV